MVLITGSIVAGFGAIYYLYAKSENAEDVEASQQTSEDKMLAWEIAQDQASMFSSFPRNNPELLNVQ